jgi:hypothetical protein
MDRRLGRGLRAAVCMALIVVLLAGCGSGADGSSQPAGNARSEVKASADAGAVDRKVEEEGTLRGPGGKVVRGWGNVADNRRVVALLRRMQRDFRAGRMGAVCRHVDTHLLAQFEPGPARPDSPCPAKLMAFADALERRGEQPLRLTLLWVRSYDWEAGVWVEDSSGERFRVPFSDLDQMGWKLGLGGMSRPETLAGTLSDRVRR